MIEDIATVQFQVKPGSVIGQYPVPPFRVGNVRKIEAVGSMVRVYLEHTDSMSPTPVPCKFTVIGVGKNTFDEIGGYVGNIAISGKLYFVYGSCWASVG